ncbi:MAG: PEP-CTERM sorting domain-containing protein [Candidatus Sulfopaludibacter sp.]|nr:PEP-CTERM sorting domain-containing protein [Candidatus Sulfopaludibacter sp.]
MKQHFALMAIITSFGLMGTASGAVIGTLNLNQCSGGSVTVDQNSITWLLASATPGYGCMEASTSFPGAQVTFSPGGTIADGEFGQIKDLTFVPATSGTDFLMFVGGGTNAGSGSINFDLGPILAAGLPACTAGMANGQTCSVNGLGPFSLQKTSTGTNINLAVSGTVSDGTTPASTWQGNFSTSFSTLTPFQIQEFIDGVDPGGAADHLGCVATGGANNGGSCSSTYQGKFDVVVSSVPEPGSMLLMGAGLIGLATVLRKRLTKTLR